MASRKRPTAPSILRRRTRQTLRRAFLAMMSPEWDLALEGKPQADVNRAGRTLLNIQRARLRLGNADLADIRDELKANEARLVKGTRALDRSLKKLSNVKTVLQTAAALLTTVGRIVGLVV